MTLHDYEIHIAGPVPAQIVAELDDAWICPRGVETVLRGFVPDQAALVGIINWLQGRASSCARCGRSRTPDPIGSEGRSWRTTRSGSAARSARSSRRTSRACGPPIG